MRVTPSPDQTPRGPAFEGRLLHRVDEDVVDQGVSFDIGTLLSRRRVLGLVGLGVGAAALAACAPLDLRATPATPAPSSATPGSATTASPATAADAATLPAGEIPQETAGPYPGDGSNGPDVLERSGIVRGDIRSSLDGGATAEGVPLRLELTILDTARGDIPFAGVAVYVWHCDAQGGYSMYSRGLEDETYLRGVQIADAAGLVSFTSVFPACYAGRWPHIHFEVYPDVSALTGPGEAIATSQVALPQGTCTSVYATAAYAGSSANLARVSLASDNVFGDDGGALQLATVTGDTATGYVASLTVRVDTATEATVGGTAGPGSR
jgi:protocatechuate 3,4-dioxygenase beta subunit